MSPRWTTPTDVEAKVRRRWDDGSLLAALAADQPFATIDLPVTGPSPSQLSDDLDAVRGWADALVRGSRDGTRYEVVQVPIGGRHVGRNLVPGRVRVTSYDQAWRLLGVEADVRAYQTLLEQSEAAPSVRAWAVVHPLRALQVAEEWEQVVAAYRWLDGARGKGRWLREIAAPGVDTKLVERHRGLLADLLGVDRDTTGFHTALGLRRKPESVRVRFRPASLGLPEPLSEGTFRVQELAALTVDVRRALIVENETTFLAAPLPADGVVLWGKGFEVSRAGALPWLRGTEVRYWGDLDTHGFAILHQLRAWLPDVRSVLMDRSTLLNHRDRWVREPSPTSARLDRLTDEESALYADLVSDRLGDAVRLEQERIDWDWARTRLG